MNIDSYFYSVALSMESSKDESRTASIVASLAAQILPVIHQGVWHPSNGTQPEVDRIIHDAYYASRAFDLALALINEFNKRYVRSESEKL
jgi:hypothetical protein